MYYRSNVTGRIISGASIRVLNDIYGDNGINDTIKFGTITPIENPTVIDCILDGTEITAMIRYREIHKCTLRAAKEGVDLVRKDMARHKSK